MKMNHFINLFCNKQKNTVLPISVAGKRTRVFIFFLFVSLCVSPLEINAQDSSSKCDKCESAQKRDAQILRQIEDYALKVKSDWSIPGMAMSIVKDGKLIYAKGFGVKDLGKPSNMPENIVDQNTVFQIGSVSKSFTAAVMATLVDEGKIKWEDTVKNILPDFRMYDKWVEQNLQVKDIMTHHTGIRGQMGTYIPNMGYGREDVYKMMKLMKPTYSFRGSYEYNNITFIIAQRIIEKLTGKSWEDNVRERIFAQVGMSSSSVNEDGFKSSADVAVPHESYYQMKKAYADELSKDIVKVGDKFVLKSKVLDSLTLHSKTFLPQVDSTAINPIYGEEQALHWLTVIGPAGSVNSTVVDLAKYAQFHLNNGKVPAGGFTISQTENWISSPQFKDVISRKNMNYLHRGQTITSQDSSRTTLYGQCWFIEQNNRYRLYFHTGTTWGFTALVAFVPELNLGMAILVNCEAESSPRYAIMRRIIDLYLQKDKKEPASENSEICDNKSEEPGNCGVKTIKMRDYEAEYIGEYAQSGRESAVKAAERKASAKEKSKNEPEVITPEFSKLTGVYDKGELFGKAQITLENDTLYITVGPLGWKHKLIHKSGTKFSFRSDGHEFPVTFMYKEKKLSHKKKIAVSEADKFLQDSTAKKASEPKPSAKELKNRKIVGLDIDFGYGENFGVWKKVKK